MDRNKWIMYEIKNFTMMVPFYIGYFTEFHINF